MIVWTDALVAKVNIVFDSARCLTIVLIREKTGLSVGRVRTTVTKDIANTNVYEAVTKSVHEAIVNSLERERNKTCRGWKFFKKFVTAFCEHLVNILIHLEHSYFKCCKKYCFCIFTGP
ncbi:hypothetical protein J6590_016518 [Homalodisca vitripennis]|nr:hypothetical protein J6590_016518 [Homalodisca vitripennis]